MSDAKEPLSLDEERILAIAKARGLEARPGPVPDAAELRRVLAMLDGALADAVTIIHLSTPKAVEVGADEFLRRVRRIREYTQNLLARLP